MNTAEVTLCNTSEVPMTYRLRVPSDGTKEPQQDNNTNNKGSDTAASAAVAILVKEFAIRPRSGTIPPDLSQDIQVRNLAVHLFCACVHACVCTYTTMCV